MPSVDDKVNQFMSAIHGGIPNNKFRNIMGQANLAEQYNKMNGGYAGYNGSDDFSMFEEEAGFGGNENYPSPQQYPMIRNQQQIPYNNYPQQYQTQQTAMLSEYQVRQLQQQYQQSPSTSGRKNFSNLPPEIAESMEKRPIDDSVFYGSLNDNSKNNYLKDNTRMDLFQDTANPWNPKPVQQQILSESQYQNNITVPKGIPIQPMMNYMPQQQINNPILDKLVENISIINKKLGINEDISSSKKDNFITLNINNKDLNGIIKQEKGTKKRILFILEDGKFCYELVPGELKRIKVK